MAQCLTRQSSVRALPNSRDCAVHLSKWSCTCFDHTRTPQWVPSPAPIEEKIQAGQGIGLSVVEQFGVPNPEYHPQRTNSFARLVVPPDALRALPVRHGKLPISRRYSSSEAERRGRTYDDRAVWLRLQFTRRSRRVPAPAPRLPFSAALAAAGRWLPGLRTTASATRCAHLETRAHHDGRPTFVCLPDGKSPSDD